MDKSKNNKAYIYAYIFSFLIIFIFSSFLIYKKNLNKDEKVVNTNSGEESVIVDNLINSGDFKEVINSIEGKGTGSLDKLDKMNLVKGYLSYGNYFYKEEENSKKALDILNTMEDNFEVLYYKGYANEIVKNYTGSLDYYNKALEIKDLSDSNKAILLNQIGHLFDLKGETDKAFSYYEKAYKLDEKNERVLSNLGIYYGKKGDYDKAYDFLNKSLNLTNNLPLKSEISMSLSSIELELNGLKPDIDKSIDYARQSIEYYPSYPMGYIALARGLYMKNDKSLYEEIETSLDKAIELSPNSYSAYEIYSLHELDKGDKEKTKNMLIKSVEAVEKDMILMDSEREKVKYGLFFNAMMIGFLNANSSDQDMMVDFIDKNKGTTSSRIAIQLKRNNYGIFSFLKDNNKFKLIIKNFK